MDSEIIYKEIGKLVKKERRRKGITQEKLAGLTSYSLCFIANIESNTHQSFSIHTLYNIASALNISIHNLIPDKPIAKKEYQLYCSNCKYIVSIPKELGKLTEDITLIAKDITFTCPNCEKKSLKIKQ